MSNRPQHNNLGRVPRLPHLRRGPLVVQRLPNTSRPNGAPWTSVPLLQLLERIFSRKMATSVPWHRHHPERAAEISPCLVLRPEKSVVRSPEFLRSVEAPREVPRLAPEIYLKGPCPPAEMGQRSPSKEPGATPFILTPRGLQPLGKHIRPQTSVSMALRTRLCSGGPTQCQRCR